jgi:hypothetical protein
MFITKPGKENSTQVSKFRPISLINVGGKVLEKLLINIIMHHIYSNNLINPNKFRITPKKSATDIAISFTQYLGKRMTEGHIATIVRLNVKCAFDAAWKPSILYTLKEFNCPKSYITWLKDTSTEGTKILNTNRIQIEKDTSKGDPQGSFFGPGFWNIQYNSLVILEYGKRTKPTAFADDLLIAVLVKTAREAENHANIEIRKISDWARENKITLNERKPQVMVTSKKKRRENKDIPTYLNNDPL